MKRYWLLTGNKENCIRAIEDKIWGVKEKNRLKACWDKISNGDIAIFYVKSPVSGVIGFGTVKAKFKQDKPLWEDEIRLDKVIYPYRWEMEIGYCLPRSEWDSKKVSIADIKIAFRAGLNLVKKDKADKLNIKIRENWNVNLEMPPKSKILLEASDKETPDLHARIQNLLMELGKLEDYFIEKEYIIDNQRLDVIWKKLEKAVPMYVFEIQVGGDIQHALGKLKHSNDMWNSNLYLIADESDRTKIDMLLSGTFHEIVDKIHIIYTNEIEELYKLEVTIEKLKEKLGLP